jgi:putative sterol carrier protein
MSMSREDIARIFPEMVNHFNPDKADGIDAVVQFDLSGDNGGQYWLKIANKTATVGEGVAENPKMTIKGAADDYAAMATGALNPMQAFMSGRIKIQGDMGLAMKFMSLFNMP